MEWLLNVAVIGVLLTISFPYFFTLLHLQMCTNLLSQYLITRYPLPQAILHDELHWLDVPQMIEYKVGVMVYRCLHGQAPRYLADNLIPASDAAPRRRHLRCANRNRLIVPRC